MNSIEYLTVKEVSTITNQSNRNVIRLISTLIHKVQAKDIIRKKVGNSWLINKDIIKLFTPKRIRKNKYYALNIDPCYDYCEKDIHIMMNYALELMKIDNIEINYVVERKNANSQNHLHCFVKCNQQNKLEKSIKTAFSKTQIKKAPIFDLDGWKSYISKYNKNIITIKS